jgi:Domain of Unknown Function (DUF928)
VNKLLRQIGISLVAISGFTSFTYSLPFQVKIAVAIADTFKFKLPPPPNRGIAGNRMGGASRISSQDSYKQDEPVDTLGDRNEIRIDGLFNHKVDRQERRSGVRNETKEKTSTISRKNGREVTTTNSNSSLIVTGDANISGNTNTNIILNRHLILTALVPEYRNFTSRKSPPELTKVWGLTANDRPTLWFDLPDSQASIDRINFILRDGDNSASKTIYRASIQPPKQIGLIKFSLPQTSAALSIDKLYKWELKLIMKSTVDRQNKPIKAEEISVTGWIQRASLKSELSDRINRSNPHQQATLYAENGFWYDALSTLAELRRDFPQDLAIRQDWINILKSVDLAPLVDRPFVK